MDKICTFLLGSAVLSNAVLWATILNPSLVTVIAINSINSIMVGGSRLSYLCVLRNRRPAELEETGAHADVHLARVSVVARVVSADQDVDEQPEVPQVYGLREIKGKKQSERERKRTISRRIFIKEGKAEVHYRHTHGEKKRICP